MTGFSQPNHNRVGLCHGQGNEALPGQEDDNHTDDSGFAGDSDSSGSGINSSEGILCQISRSISMPQPQLGMLEVNENDFARLEADMKVAEAFAQGL